MIKVLDSLIADKIAAGEVIERPVSIVKELVENSIDAGAKTIYVEIKNGGKSYIRVTDNGCGISEGDLPKSILRHATSKISTVDDLNKISTLGFRGEALASIAAVSRLTIVSRTADKEAGLKSVFHGGQEVSTEFVGANIGTTIIVEDLFYNTPARKKFLSTNARETSAIIDLLENYAIYYADIKFALVSNNSTIFSTDGDSNVMNALTTIYPTNDYKNLIHIESGRIKGYISNPGVTKTTRRGQLFFVNGRMVDSKVIEKGIMQGYGDRIFSGYPIAILFLTIEPENVDVNIHPAKKEVKFLNENEIIEEISITVNAAMHQEESIPEFTEKPRSPGEKTVINYNPVSATKQNDRATTLKEFLTGLSKRDNDSSVVEEESSEIENTEDIKEEPIENTTTEIVSEDTETPTLETVEKNDEPEIEDINAIIYGEDYNKQPIEQTPEQTIEQSVIESSEVEEPVLSPFTAPEKFNFDDLAYKGYIFNTYIIMQADNNIYLFDQHAAHERVFYEKFKKEYENSDKIPQPILTPITITVPDSIYSMDIDWMDEMYDMGFEVHDFGPNTFVVKGIPSYMALDEAEGFAREFVENLGEYSKNEAVTDKLILKSCKSAVKGNNALSMLEIKDLMIALSKCENPFSCPHGRPTFLKVTKEQVEKAFKRR